MKHPSFKRPETARETIAAFFSTWDAGGDFLGRRAVNSSIKSVYANHGGEPDATTFREV
jgi:hypothetical protein